MIQRHNTLIRLFLISAAILIILPSLSLAQSSKADADKPLFFVNTNSSFEFMSGGNYGFTVLKQLVEAAGYRFDHGLHPEINADYLEGISVYFLPVRKFFLLNTEKVVLRKFIRAGGVVIFTNYTYIRNEDTFTKEFGIEYRDTSLSNNYGVVPSTSPVAGPNSISRTHPGQLIHLRITDPNKAVALAETEAGRIYAAEAIGTGVGQGRLFVLSCMRGIHDNNVGGYVNDVDNKNFLRNIMDYLKGKYDLTILRVKPKGTNLHPGSEFTLIAKIKNIGDKTSDPTRLAFYITDDGELGDEGPATTIKLVEKVSFEALDAGKSRLVKVPSKVPSWLSPGSYIIVAKVDPNELSDDENMSNNIKKAKKKLKVKE